MLALYEQTLRVRAKWNTIGELLDVLRRDRRGEEAFAEVMEQVPRMHLERTGARKAEGRSHPTVNGSLRILRAALRNAVEQRELAEMPCRIKLLKETKKLPMILAAEEVDRLLAFAPAPIDLVILIAAKAGLRHQEIRFLQVRDADLARSILLVRAKHGWTPKDHEERSIPIAGRLRERLQHRRSVASLRPPPLPPFGAPARSR